MGTDERAVPPRRWYAALWRELCVPALVAAGVVLILVALIEGESAGDFLYAIF